MATNPAHFQPEDYAVFVVLLFVSCAIGIIYGLIGYFKGKNKTGEKEEVTIVKKRDLSVWPAALSVIASSSAAPFVLGVPSEIYAFGTEFTLLFIGLLIGVPILTHVILVRFHNLKITNTFEFLEIRFNKPVRAICSLFFLAQSIIALAVVTYAPATALSAVTGLPVEAAIAIVGAVAVTYTAIGGLGGIVWVDGAQMLLLLASMLALIIKGIHDVGGIDEVWRRAEAGGRIQFDEFDPHPTVRHSLWTQSIGGSFFWFVVFLNQTSAQKFLCLPTVKKLYITAYMAIAIKTVYIILLSLEGIVMYAYFAYCSPILAGVIKATDQLVPFFAIAIFRKQPGMAGLFIVALFSACLSAIAGGLNALTSVTLMDVIQPAYAKRHGGQEIKASLLPIVFRCIVVCICLITTALAYVVPVLGPNVLQIILNLINVVGGPICGIFFAGVCIPCINNWGASIGVVLSLAYCIWISVGAIVIQDKYGLMKRQMLSLSAERCPRPPPMNMTNVTTSSMMTTYSGMTTGAWNATTPLMHELPNPSGIEKMYEISYMWYSFIGMLLAILIAFLVSFVTGFRRGEPVDTDLSYMCCYKNATNSVTRAKTDDRSIPRTRSSSLRSKASTSTTTSRRNSKENKRPPPPYNSATPVQVLSYKKFHNEETENCHM